MPDSGRVRVAHLARSCARFLGRAALLSRDRVSGESVALLYECERAVAELLRQAADVLVEYTTGASGADEKLLAACASFAADTADVRAGLDADPSLGLLRDVFADVLADAAKVGPLETADPSRAHALAYGGISGPRRRRPTWQPPVEPGD